MLLAQAGDPLGGWGSLLLQGGAFALLAYIVMVLYPREAKEIRFERSREAKDARDERVARDDKLAAMILVMQEGFSQRSDKVVNALEKQTAILMNTQEKSAERIENAVKTVCQFNKLTMPVKT